MENVIRVHGGTIATHFSTTSNITHIISSKRVHQSHVNRRDKDAVTLSQALYDEARQNEIWPILETEIATQLLNVCARCGDDMLEKSKKSENVTPERKRVTKGVSFIQVKEMGLKEGFLVFETEDKIPKPNVGNVNKTYGIFSSAFAHTLKSEMFHCECCNKHVVEPNAHLVSSEHKKFRENESNFKKLDVLFKEVKANGMKHEMGLIKKEIPKIVVPLEDVIVTHVKQSDKKKQIVLKDGIEYVVHSSDRPAEMRSRKKAKLEQISPPIVEPIIEKSEIFKAPTGSPKKRTYRQTTLFPEKK